MKKTTLTAMIPMKISLRTIGDDGAPLPARCENSAPNDAMTTITTPNGTVVQ